jgi:hypothetical protein
MASGIASPRQRQPQIRPRHCRCCRRGQDCWASGTGRSALPLVRRRVCLHRTLPRWRPPPRPLCGRCGSAMHPSPGDLDLDLLPRFRLPFSVPLSADVRYRQPPPEASAHRPARPPHFRCCRRGQELWAWAWGRPLFCRCLAVCVAVAASLTCRRLARDHLEVSSLF